MNSAAEEVPDVRDMDLISTVCLADVPEPLVVHENKVELPRSPGNELVAVYLADEYNPSLAPDAQTATPLSGNLELVGRTVRGLTTVRPGALVHVAVRRTLGGPAQLACSATSAAWRDASVTVGTTYCYRIIAQRQARTGLQSSITVRSLPSDIGEGAAYDAQRPSSPAAQAVWDPARGLVQITWVTVGVAPDVDVSIQRTLDEDEYWLSLGAWVAVSTGRFEDARAASGSAYRYRLRVRNGDGRVSRNEPVIGPIAVP